MRITEASSSYEAWMQRHTSVVRRDLEIKHKRMAESPFRFLRATYYRWVQLWPKVCPDLAEAPRLLSVGDLHIENFGTWRDTDGRLVWGINDFDEAFPASYTNDLVRLATSALLAIEASHLQLGKKIACDAILEGYYRGMKNKGRPFVLAESHEFLRGIAIEALRDPAEFWARFDALPRPSAEVPPAAKAILEWMLPEKGMSYELMARVAGMGSLGRPRFVAVTDWRGGRIARETKPLIPSAHVWATDLNPPRNYYQAIVTRAIRVQDPFLHIRNGWIVRRLAPDCAKIDLSSLPGLRDEVRLLRAMGAETANIHLATLAARAAVRHDLKRREPDWLLRASKEMVGAVKKDWNGWNEGQGYPA